MLQLWQQKRLHAWVHSSQERHRRRFALSVSYPTRLIICLILTFLSQPCAAISKDISWNATLWAPLIDDRSFFVVARQAS